jgi:hypothetical protein
LRHNRHTVTGKGNTSTSTARCCRDANRDGRDGVTQTVTVVTMAHRRPSQLTHSTKRKVTVVTVVTQKSPLVLTATLHRPQAAPARRRREGGGRRALNPAITSRGSRDTWKHMRQALRPSGGLRLIANAGRGAFHHHSVELCDRWGPTEALTYRPP